MPSRRRVRSYLLLVHEWTGLAVGLLFTMLGITGSMLVFYLDVDEVINPETQVSRRVHEPTSPEAILSQLRKSFPEREGPWRIEMPMTPETPVMARYYKPPERADRFFSPLMVTIDPATLAVTSDRFWGDYAVTWIYDLHYTLLLGENGRTTVGFVGLLMMASLVSGLYLWWPSRRRALAALKPQLRQGSARRVYDLHVLGGTYFWVLLALLAVTGSALALPDQTRTLLGASGHQHGPATVSAPVPGGERHISLDAAVMTARSRFPDAEVRWVESSGVGGTPISVRLYQQSEPGRRFPRTQVWIHPVSGEIISVHDPMWNGTADGVMDWLHPLHNGEALGITGRVIVLLSGLVLPLLFVTGVMRWRQKAKVARHKVRAGY